MSLLKNELLVLASKKNIQLFYRLFTGRFIKYDTYHDTDVQCNILQFFKLKVFKSVIRSL